MLVFAHRGASAELPEHTLAAYLRALADGADGLECDVRLTRDGHLVCVHDWRLNRTSNGRGLVSRRTLSELHELDFGSWHEGAPNADDPELTRVLTLDRLLGAVQAAGRPVQLLIETKHPTKFGAEVERKLLQLLAEHGLATPDSGNPVQVTVMSFSPMAVRRVRTGAPGLPTVQLLDLIPPGMRTGRVPVGTPVAGPSVELVRARPALVPALRAAGKRVYLWTVNTAEDVALARSLEVDGVITDRPADVRSALAA